MTETVIWKNSLTLPLVQRAYRQHKYPLRSPLMKTTCSALEAEKLPEHQAQDGFQTIISEEQETLDFCCLKDTYFPSFLPNSSL